MHKLNIRNRKRGFMLFLHMNATMIDFRRKGIVSLEKYIIIFLYFMPSSLHVKNKEVSCWGIMLKNLKISLDKLFCDQKDLSWVG